MESVKSIYIKDLKPRDLVHSSFLVKSKELPLARNGKPYLAMNLMDKTGEIDARVWDGAEERASLFKEGDVLAIGGKVNSFQNRLQLIVDHLTPLPSQEVDLGCYLPMADVDLKSLYGELLDVFRNLKNPWVSRLALALLEDPEIGERFKRCPAGKTVHHSFIGGLLCHSMQIIRLIDAIVPLYDEIDRDILVFGAAFHDFGKIYELSYHGDFGYTDEGRLVGHISIAVCLIDQKIREISGFPKDLEWQLKHIVLSHHGRLEFGSPKKPATIEAEVLHYLDSMDSKIDGIHRFMKADRSRARWTSYHKNYEQYYYRPDCLIPGESK